MDDIVELIASHKFSTQYQAIVDSSTLETYAYEALARFSVNNKNIPPDTMFARCHKNLDIFFLLEVHIKKFQLNNRPKGYPLFLNLDPDICISEMQIRYWLNLFDNQKDIVIEIIENLDQANLEHVRLFIEWLEEYKIRFALDDFGKDGSLFSAELTKKSEYIKLDIDFLRHMKVDSSYIELLRGVVNFAKLSGKKTILEGVENKEDIELARLLKIDYIQGFYFKDRFEDIIQKSDIDLYTG